uniref:Prenyltransferase alpha-alpha toroid domain-containing protein n=1 Tax=Opuntia streptacantha TaxID=393608 RepID=A0A7C9A332_OPUST
MILINEAHRLDLPALINWVVFRQGVEGGFQGRTNKLVDGCYSFWQGGIFPLIQRLQEAVNEQMQMPSDRRQDGSFGSQPDSSEKEDALPKVMSPLEKNVGGGPQCVPNVTKLSDIGLDFIKCSANMGPLFHNLSLQQYIILCSQVMDGGLRDKPGKGRDFYHTCYCLSGLSVCQYIAVEDSESSPLPQEVLGPYSNLLEPIHPLYNVILDRYYEAHEFFSRS